MSQQSLRRSFVTAADVAKRAGVSRSAVSRTFTPGASVSSEVRERILRAADHLGYRVNRLAQSLINARSNVIGLVGTDLHQPFHAELLATLSGALLANGFQCMLLNAANAARDMGALIERVLEYRVGAIVVMTGTPPSRIVEECLSNGVPVILVNKLLPGLAVDTVVADHAAGGQLAADCLLAAGCRRLAVVSSAARTASLMGRLNAFRSRAADAGLRVRVWQDGPTEYRAGWEAARAILAEERFDGVFCVTDLLALGFLDAARSQCARRIPEDLSVIGFDDIPQAGWSAYELTTFCQSVEDLAAAVMKAIRCRADTPVSPRTLTTVPVRLIVRSTVRGLGLLETSQ
ncbi:MAG TPA: LacI family DNA-binding transcriptional regulator [Casimicrobiaceae bacterium]|jgi:DNA-binding LacI/PurR family transcriptional regulator